MYPDPIRTIRSQYEAEVTASYRYTRQMLIQTIWGEITRPELNLDQITRYIDRDLAHATTRVSDATWRYIDSVYKQGISHAQAQIDLNASVLASYTNEDQKRTDMLIADCNIAVEKQNNRIKADILKTLDKGQANTIFIKTIKDAITQQYIPSLITVIQTHAGTAYNEAVWSRIRNVCPKKKWCFVTDYQGNEYHKPLDDITLAIDDEFLLPVIEVSKTKDIPGVGMLYPHDQTHKPHPLNVNDCRCFIEGIF